MEIIKTLGVFDSGLGGYTIYDALQKANPGSSIVLLADQLNAPYGAKSVSELISLTFDAMTWFEEKEIFDVVIACNTVSATALDAVVRHKPNMNIYGIIDLTVDAGNFNENDKVGIISTVATHQSNAYVQSLNERGVNDVISCPLPNLVPLIEGLKSDEEVVSYLEQFKGQFLSYDKMILGCTHYPIVSKHIESIFGVVSFNSKGAVVKAISAKYEIKEGNSGVYTTGNEVLMQQQILTLFNQKEDVKHDSNYSV